MLSYDAPFAFVVDNLVYGNSFLVAQDLFDIEQIEILKGSRGALYGKGSIAGAVSIKTRMPTNDFSARASMRAGNGSELRFKAAVSGAIVEDKVLFSVSGMYGDFDGVIDNVFRNSTEDYREQAAGRARLIFTPSDKLNIDLRAMVFGNADFDQQLPGHQDTPFGWPVLSGSMPGASWNQARSSRWSTGCSRWRMPPLLSAAWSPVPTSVKLS